MRREFLNANIHETIYHAALTESAELAKKDGPYETFQGSPLSNGEFQFNLWSLVNQQRVIKPMDIWDWEDLRDTIMSHGVEIVYLLHQCLLHQHLKF